MAKGIVMERSNKETNTIVAPTVPQLKEALKASGYRIYNERGEEETSFIGFATLYGKKELVGIFDSIAYSTNAIRIRKGVPVVTDWSVSGAVRYGDIQKMNDSLTFGGGIETVYYNDGHTETFNAGEKKF